MVKVYESMYVDTSDGQVFQPDRKQLTIPVKNINDDGTFDSFVVGTGNVVNEGQCLMFIVDSNTAEQVEKLKLDVSGILPKLALKDGEVLEEKLTEQQKKVIELEQQLLIERANLNNEQGE